MGRMIVEKVQEILRMVMDDETLEATPELSANDVEAWDSMNHVNLIVSVENEFGIRFSNDEISTMQNLGDLLTLVESKLNKR